MIKHTRRTLVRKISLISFRLFTFITGKIHIRVNYWIGSFIINAIYILLFRHRKAALESLTVAFPYKTLSERKKIAKTSVNMMGQGFLETLYFIKNKHKLNNVRIEGRQYLEEALKQGRGVMVFTAHFGNFPLLDVKLAKEGYPVNIILRPIRDPQVGECVYDLCAQAGIKTILSYPREEVVRDTKRHCAIKNW